MTSRTSSASPCSSSVDVSVELPQSIRSGPSCDLMRTFRTVSSDKFCCRVEAVRHRTARRLWQEARPDIVGATAKQQIEALALRGDDCFPAGRGPIRRGPLISMENRSLRRRPESRRRARCVRRVCSFSLKNILTVGRSSHGQARANSNSISTSASIRAAGNDILGGRPASAAASASTNVRSLAKRGRFGSFSLVAFGQRRLKVV